MMTRAANARTKAASKQAAAKAKATGTIDMAQAVAGGDTAMMMRAANALARAAAKAASAKAPPPNKAPPPKGTSKGNVGTLAGAIEGKGKGGKGGDLARMGPKGVIKKPGM